MILTMDNQDDKTNGKQTANRLPNGTFAPKNEIGNRFKSGKSGNSEGRPEGAKNLSTLLKEMLDDIAPGEIINSKFVKEFCKGRKSITNADALTARLLSEGLIKGEAWAVKEIYDRTEGKAAQSLNLSGNLSIKTFADLALEAEKEIIE